MMGWAEMHNISWGGAATQNSSELDNNDVTALSSATSVMAFKTDFERPLMSEGLIHDQR